MNRREMLKRTAAAAAGVAAGGTASAAVSKPDYIVGDMLPTRLWVGHWLSTRPLEITNLDTGETEHLAQYIDLERGFLIRLRLQESEEGHVKMDVDDDWNVIPEKIEGRFKLDWKGGEMPPNERKFCEAIGPDNYRDMVGADTYIEGMDTPGHWVSNRSPCPSIVPDIPHPDTRVAALAKYAELKEGGLVT